MNTSEIRARSPAFEGKSEVARRHHVGFSHHESGAAAVTCPKVRTTVATPLTDFTLDAVAACKAAFRRSWASLTLTPAEDGVPAHAAIYWGAATDVGRDP